MQLIANTDRYAIMRLCSQNRFVIAACTVERCELESTRQILELKNAGEVQMVINMCVP